MSAQYRWKYCRFSLHCKCIAGLCDYYDKTLCLMEFKDEEKEDITCIAFPQRWGMMFSKEEELKIDEALGFGG